MSEGLAPVLRSRKNRDFIRLLALEGDVQSVAIVFGLTAEEVRFCLNEPNEARR